VNDLGSDSATPHEESLIDDLLDGPTNGGAAQTESLTEGNFVLEPRPDGQLSAENGLLDPLGDLEVQGDGSGALEIHEELHRQDLLSLIHAHDEPL